MKKKDEYYSGWFCLVIIVTIISAYTHALYSFAEDEKNGR
jgi:hypothetical protein